MRKALTTLFRPSTLIRGFWLGVTVLHLALFARRLFEGDWAGLLNQVRLALALVASAYGTLKFWRIATIFDGSPRKILSFALLLVIGHLAVSPVDYSKLAVSVFSESEWSQVLLAAPSFLLIVGFGFMTAAAATKKRNSARRTATIRLQAFISPPPRRFLRPTFGRAPPINPP